ncbi:altronate dehydratase family protein [Pontibacter korlensis]|uniref:Altronate hydrolase n=1 Tax=Pontibacter korlensis TaxID=400092 RepID=A0A0E3UW04_9BACT|nr:altronate dehydratase family protein [Pontibacter korlensis]AKD02281.1 altronate hydrolase [Pontibacter korlensis]
MITTKQSYLQIHPKDNVLVALQDQEAGTGIYFNGQEFPLRETVQAKHKFTAADFAPGAEVYMYGVLVGKTTCALPAGSLLTTENLKHAAQDFAQRTGQYEWQAPEVSKWKDRTFMGYHRADGQVGTRNYWLVLPLVFCENRNIETLKNAFLKELGYASPDKYQAQVRELADLYRQGKDLREYKPNKPSESAAQHRLFPNVDGVKFIVHDGGCGGTREDADNLCALLAGYCVNPNVAGITVLSLGCQHAQVAILQEKIKERDPDFSKPLLIFEQQQAASESLMLSEAILQTFIGIAEANHCERKPATLDKLVIGVECGGSDGFSGISANPAVGYTADLVAALGGKVVLSEFPELCGVEQELINRCVDEETADRFVRLMREYAARAEAVGSGFDMNPSPGNIRDGLITDAIKSAGAAKKGGTSPVTDVLGYGQYVRKRGLTLLCTPGNDVESTTAMAGAGCNVQLFTTGLGTPTGNPVSPVVKVATNTSLANRLPDIIDLNAGAVISGDKTIEELGEEYLEYIIGLASGEYDTKAMELGQDDFIFWKRGVSL